MKKLVGRTAEVAIIMSGLLDGGSSFLVTGSPGSGKSALAETVAAQLKKTIPKKTPVNTSIDTVPKGIVRVLSETESYPDGSILILDLAQNLVTKEATNPELWATMLTDIIVRIGQRKHRLFLTMTDVPPEFHQLEEQGTLTILPLPDLSDTEAEELLLSEAGQTMIDIDTRDRILIVTKHQPKLLLGVTAALVGHARSAGAKTLEWNESVIASAPAVQELLINTLAGTRSTLTETILKTGGEWQKFLEIMAVAEASPIGMVQALSEQYLNISVDKGSVKNFKRSGGAELEQLVREIFTVQKDPVGAHLVTFQQPLLQIALRAKLSQVEIRKYSSELYKAAIEHLAKDWHDPLRNRAILWGRNAGEQVPWGWLQGMVESRQLTDSFDKDIEICSAIIAHPEAKPRDRAVGYILRAERLRFTQHPSAASEDLGRALQQFKQDPDKKDIVLIVEIAFIAADIEQYTFDKIQDSLDRLETVEALVKSFGVKKALRELQIGKAARVAYSGDFRNGVLLIKQARKAYQIADLLPLASAKILIWSQRGKYKEAVKFGNKALLSSMLLGSKGARRSAEIVAALYLSSLVSGDLQGASRLEQRANLARRNTSYVGQYDTGLVELGAGLSLLHQGLWTDACLVLEVAVIRLRKQDPSGFLPLALAALTLATAATGDRLKTLEHSDELEIIPPRSSRILEGVVRGYRLQALHWIQDDRTLLEAEKLSNWAKKHELPLVQLIADYMKLMVQKRFLKTEIEHLRNLAETIDAPLAQSIVDHVDEMAEQKSAAAFGKAARMLARQGYWIPTGLDLPELTEREIEIATMAGLGFSSRLIAQKFTISKRTVDSHLSSIFNKLGLNQREDIADILERIS